MIITAFLNTCFTMAIGHFRTKGMERGEIGRQAKRKRRALPTIRGTTTPSATPTTRHQKISAMPEVMALRTMESVVTGATWRLYYIIR